MLCQPTRTSQMTSTEITVSHNDNAGEFEDLPINVRWGIPALRSCYEIARIPWSKATFGRLSEVSADLLITSENLRKSSRHLRKPSGHLLNLNIRSGNLRSKFAHKEQNGFFKRSKLKFNTFDRYVIRILISNPSNKEPATDKCMHCKTQTTSVWGLILINST